MSPEVALGSAGELPQWTAYRWRGLEQGPAGIKLSNGEGTPRNVSRRKGPGHPKRDTHTVQRGYGERVVAE
jgi:hypothetical protein